MIDRFLEYEPNEGAETRFRTEARVAYDDRNLYVFVRMFDPAPDSIVSLLARRDERVPSEQLKLVIDSYHDGRTAYQFAVNPAGVKRDFYVYNDNVEDGSWDAVWDVATLIDSTGWAAEFRIPLSQLRYANLPEHTFRPADRARRGAHRAAHQLAALPSCDAGLCVADGDDRRDRRIAGAAAYRARAVRRHGEPHAAQRRRLRASAAQHGGRGPQGRAQHRACAAAFRALRQRDEPDIVDDPRRRQSHGRLGSGMSVGLLDGVTGEEMGTEGRAIEPRTIYAVGRMRQDLRGGRSDIGLMATAVNRALDGTAEPFLRDQAYAAGIDTRHRFGPNDSYELSATLTGSLVRGTADALLRTQRDAVHNYQRPDGGYDLDPTRTRLGGDAERISVSKFGGGMTRFQSVYQRSSPGFEINDLGFLSRADEQLFRNWFQLAMNTPNRFQQRAFHNFNHWSNWTADGLPTNLGFNYNGHTQLRSFWWVHMGGNVNGVGTTYDDRAARGGPAVRRSRSTSVWGGVESDSRQRTYFSLFAGTSTSDAGQSHDWYVNPSMTYRVGTQFSGSLGLNYSEAVNDNQWRANVADDVAEVTHYTFARLEQSTLGLTARANYTFTPTLTLQLYAQPFVSTGRYSDWRELADPRAAQYDDRYQPYAGGDPGGLRSLQFRTNSVLRWEYRPGSALFLVWQQGRDAFDGDAYDFDLQRDRRELFALHPANTLLLKMSYWLNP